MKPEPSAARPNSRVQATASLLDETNFAHADEADGQAFAGARGGPVSGPAAVPPGWSVRL